MTTDAQFTIKCDGTTLASLAILLNFGLIDLLKFRHGMAARIATNLILYDMNPTGKEIGRGAYGRVFEVDYQGTLCAAKDRVRNEKNR